jgi:hypothetical protein
MLQDVHYQVSTILWIAMYVLFIRNTDLALFGIMNQAMLVAIAVACEAYREMLSLFRGGLKGLVSPVGMNRIVILLLYWRMSRMLRRDIARTGALRQRWSQIPVSSALLIRPKACKLY